MSWHTTGDPEELVAAAGDFLHADPAGNSVILTVVAAMCERRDAAAADEQPMLGWWRREGAPAAGVFMHTPPYPLHLGAMPDEAVPPLVDLLARDPAAVAGVNGDRAATDAFAAAWSERTGAVARVQRRVRLHRLDELADPDPRPEGRAVVAGAEHRDVLVAWYEAFAAEIEEPAHDVRPMVDDGPRSTRARARCCSTPTSPTRPRTGCTRGSATGRSRTG